MASRFRMWGLERCTLVAMRASSSRGDGTNCATEIGDGKRFGQEDRSSLLDPGAGLVIGVAGDHDEREGPPSAPPCFQDVEPRVDRHADIGDDDELPGIRRRTVSLEGPKELSAIRSF